MLNNINVEYFKDKLEFTSMIVRTIYIFLCVYYTNFKITNKKLETSLKIIFNIVYLIFSAVICGIIQTRVNYIISLFCSILLITILFSKENITKGMLTTTISFAINYIIMFFSVIISFFINILTGENNDYVNLIIILTISLILLYRLFKFKRLKYGLSFLKSDSTNEYIDVIILNVGVIILFLTIIIIDTNIDIARNLFLCLGIMVIIMFITIQKSLQLYYKQKMLIKELDETKEDLARAENKIKILERENIEESKKRHTVIHKQKSLEYKIEEMLTKTEMSTEEAAEVKERLEKLNKEIYTEKEVMELDKTGINSIDDMLKYMQSECVKNKIDFTLQIKGNIHYMVHNLVKEEELETLLADHIKDAIIAINHTNNANRSILVRLGNIDDIYSLYIYDSGVEFKPEVLESLGKKPCTTYANEGGTGMGFMNTFDTVRKHKASLIIEEIGKPVKDNYTKVIIIKFDKKNEFKVKSYHKIEKV